MEESDWEVTPRFNLEVPGKPGVKQKVRGNNYPGNQLGKNVGAHNG